MSKIDTRLFTATFLFLIPIVSMTTMDMAYAQTGTIYMQDTTKSYGLSTYSGRPVHSEYVTSSSILVGKSIDTITVYLKKIGLPTGTIQIGVFNSDLSVKKLVGSMSSSAVSTDYTMYTFSTSVYQIQSGDRIGIKFSGGDSSNYVAIMTDQSDTFDGVQSYLSYYENIWKNYSGDDLSMMLSSSYSCQTSQVSGVTAIGNDGNIPQNTIDGSLATRWSNLGIGSWINLDLGEQKTICGVDTAWYLGDQRSNNFVISTSSDGTTFTNVYSGKSSGTTSSFENYTFPHVNARYVKITVNGNTQNNWASISEVHTNTYGSSTDTTPPTVTATPTGASYSSTQLVTLSASEPATIYYTKDGTTPTTSSTVYTNPVSISSTTTLKFFAKDTAGNIGSIVSQTYTISTSALRLDSFGVQQFYAQEPGRQSFVLTDPNKQAGVKLESGGPAVSAVNGGFHYYTITPYVGSLASGGTELTMRIELTPQLSTGTTLEWPKAETHGYQTSTNDIDEYEMTGYFQVRNTVTDDHISFKVGGEHTSDDPLLAGTFGIKVDFNGVDKETSEKELTFPDYEFFEDKLALSTGSIVGKWVGIKVISTHVPIPFAGLCTSTNPCKAQLYKTYIDQNPIDFTTGKPKNNWKFLFSHLDDGSESGKYKGHKTTWGMKEFQYRINAAKNIDFAYLSVRDIDPTTGQNIPS